MDLKDICFEDDQLAIGRWEFWDKIENLIKTIEMNYENKIR